MSTSAPARVVRGGLGESMRTQCRTLIAIRFAVASDRPRAPSPGCWFRAHVLSLLLPACSLPGSCQRVVGPDQGLSGQDLMLQPQDPSPPAAVKNGASHAVSSTVANVHGYGAVPILRKSLFWDGNGEDDVYGVGIEAHRYVTNGFAFGMSLDTSLWK